MVEHRVLENLLNVFIADLGWFFTWRAQVLPTIDCEVDLGIAKVFGFVIRQQEHCAITHTLADLCTIASFLLL